VTRSGAVRAGFTLVELITTVVVLSFLILGVARMMLPTFRASNQATAAAYRNATLTSEVARMTVMPYGYLTAGTTCVNTPGGVFPNARCTTVTFLTSEVRQIRVVVTPLRATLLAPDTVTFERGR
jgi:prepilin-type N-terminal cleavage/methylation domain-containing protein